MGRKWRDVPPDQKPNWDYLNESQRRYAWEQYNLARVRRGLPINHPIPDREEPEQAWSPTHEEAVAAGAKELGVDPEEPETRSDHDEENNDNPIDSVSDRDSDNMADRMDVDQPGGSNEATPVKRNRTASAAGAKRRLPGTGGDEENRGQPLEGGPRRVALPNPSAGIPSYVRYFRKTHRVFSYGLAYKILKTTVTDPTAINIVVLTTPLMEVPWDRRFYYINPSEFALLPKGSSFNKCRISITQRNVRIAFPTNNSANNLATLNQNKNIVYARGLYKKVNSIPLKYTGFQADQPMIPTGVAWPGRRAPEVDYNQLITDMYGSQETTADFLTNVPKHQVGIPQVYPYYCCMVMSNYNNTATQNTVMGWECLQRYYTELDADASVGNEIFTAEYHPQCGLCKLPPTPLYRNYNTGNLAIPRGSHTLLPHVDTLTLFNSQSNTQEQQEGVVLQQTEQAGVNLQQPTPFSLAGFIEQSQAIYQGNFKHAMVEAQDSVHIGVQPTFALTSQALTTGQTNSSFTDTQAYFEIVAECEINTSYPTFRPLYTALNVKEGDQWKETTMQRVPLRGMYDGLYVYLPQTPINNPSI